MIIPAHETEFAKDKHLDIRQRIFQIMLKRRLAVNIRQRTISISAEELFAAWILTRLNAADVSYTQLKIIVNAITIPTSRFAAALAMNAGWRNMSEQPAALCCDGWVSDMPLTRSDSY